MLVRLVARKELYGVKMKQTDIRKIETESGLTLDEGIRWSPENFVPTEGIVEISCMPEVQKGDRVHMEYFGVITNLGKWWSKISQTDERNFILKETKKGVTCSVFINKEYIYYVENKEGKIKMLNGYNIIEPIYMKQKGSVIMPTAKTNYATVTHGDFAGKVIIFHRNSDMGGTVHKRTVVQNKYVDGTFEKGKILPSAERVCIIPDKPKSFNSFGLIIPIDKREIPNLGTVESVGSKIKNIKAGERINYFFNTATVVTVVNDVSLKGEVRLLIDHSRIPMLVDEF